MLQNVRYEKWFYAFVILHILVWTLAPTLVRFTLPLDAMEGATWGHQFEWGYDKNAFLNAWLTHLAVIWGGNSGWLVYFFSQICMAACFWVVWQFGKKILTPVYAVVAVLLLEGIQYYNLHAIDFDDNTLEIGLWALTAWFFYLAVQQQKIRDWLWTGFFASLGFIAKYYTAMLLFPMLVFLLWDKQGRRSFAQAGLYWGLLLFIGMLMPHLMWLFKHNFITLNYAVDRVSSVYSWTNHLTYPLAFAWEQAQAMLVPTVLLMLVALNGRPFLAKPRLMINDFDKRFLLLIGCGPFVVTIILAAVAGMKLRAGWGEPLLSFWTLILLALVQPYFTPARFYRFFWGMIILLFTLVAVYCYSLITAGDSSSANYPGKKMAVALTQQWHDAYHVDLKYVAGERWLAGNIAFFSADKPAVYIDWTPALSPWIKESQLKKSGAIFVWELDDDDDDLPVAVKQRYPQLENFSVQHFNWLRDNKVSPVAVGVAFLPPETVQ